MTEGRPTPDPNALETLDRLDALKSKENEKERKSVDTALSNASIDTASEFSKPSASTKGNGYRLGNGFDRMMRMLGQTPNREPGT